MCRRQTSPAHAVLGGLAATAIHRARVILHLLDFDKDDRSLFRADQEAAIITRSQVDLAITATYLTAAPGVQRDHLAARFLAFENIQLEKLTGPDRRSGPRKAASALRVFKNLDEMAYRGWSGLTNTEMVRAIRDKRLRGLGEDLTEHFRELSVYVHPSPSGTRLPVAGPSLADEQLDYSVPWAAAIATEIVARGLYIALDRPMPRKTAEMLDKEKGKYIAVVCGPEPEERELQQPLCSTRVAAHPR